MSDRVDPAPQENPSASGRARENVSADSSTVRRIVLVAAVSALAGLLFGYDNGIIGSAMLFIATDFQLDSGTRELVVSMILLGAVAGAPVGGALSQRIGRRRVVLLVGIVFAVGAVLAAVAPGVELLVAARFLLGIAVGGASSTVPIYIAELSPPRVRGRLMVLFELMVAAGVLVSYVVGYALGESGSWRPMLGLAVVPAMVLVVGMIFLPESPRWLIQRGRLDEARQVLESVRPSDPELVDNEIREIVEINDQEATGGWRALRQPWVRPVLVIALGIAMFSQVTGINALVYYAPTILSDVGFGTSGSLLAGVGVGAALLSGSIAGTFLIDRIGRRRILLYMIPGAALSMFVLAGAFLLELTTPVAWTVVVAIMAFVFFNGGSIQMALWMIGPEIFPFSVRGPSTSLATATAWAFNCLVSFTALTAIDVFGQVGTFLIYACMNVLCLIFVFRVVPDPTGHSLEQIESVLRRGDRLVDELGK